MRKRTTMYDDELGPTPTIDLLRQLGTKAASVGICSLFEKEPDRFDDFSASLDDLTLDYSKTALSREDRESLFAFARASKIEQRRDEMFAGQRINTTEDRSVLHVALRGETADCYMADGVRVSNDVENVLEALGAFADGVRNGSISSSNQKKFTDVVNIGIGGSDLGPCMSVLALSPYHDGPRMHFVSNIDSSHLTDVLRGLDPASTLFIVASKTFTTIETMTNAATARLFITGALGETAVAQHFCAVSTALDKVKKFGIDPTRSFGFWDWVGGRYSIWSAIGLPLMLAIGPVAFRQFLSGARSMDQHFRHAPMEGNLPILLGLVGWWHRVAQGYSSRALIPYDQRLARFPAYVQQLDMESNGKSIGLDGQPVPTPTGPVVWGEPGTNGQHAFFQLLHQGTDTIPVEFLIAAQSHEPDLQEHQDLLIANCIAQSEALARGRTLEEAREQLASAGRSESQHEVVAKHRQFSGERPSITLFYKKLDPYGLGRIIALYEHRVFVEAQLYGINAFDQWGVELGKELAMKLLPVVRGEIAVADSGRLTQGLAEQILSLRKRPAPNSDIPTLF
ncbi:glucose-6-phosphate isomerase [Phyllobacterium sp. SB3]|uniref:glucose-6-phosphate isomerase n=1 Tax=Phyllobacterium sp. SB3 TaxID=3156073 RepID=UPI0032AF69C7